MIAELGYCNGIENYSRHLSRPPAGRAAADAHRLFPEGLPPRRRRVASDRAAGASDVGRRPRAQEDARRLRLPAAERDRQPSAVVRRVRTEARSDGSTSRLRPGTYELEKTGGLFAEQVIRPTGLLDPQIVIRPVKGQVDDLIGVIKRADGEERARAWSRR